MKPMHLNDQVRYDIPKAPSLSEEEKLAAEIAERMREWKRLDYGRLATWIARIHHLTQIGPRLTDWYLMYQSGDHSAIGTTLDEMAETHGYSKQAEEQELKKEMDNAPEVFFPLVRAIKELRNQAICRAGPPSDLE